MSAWSANPLDLFTRMLQVKRRALLLFFGGGTVMALLSIFIPPRHAPDPLLGQMFFGLIVLLALPQTLLILRWPAVLQHERLDWLFMISGNVCVLLSAAAETLMFGSQSSAMVALWPMVFAAGFLNRRLFWWQVVLGTLCITGMGLLKAIYITHGGWWMIDVIVLAVPLAFTGLAVSFFREAATHEAQELAQMVATDPLTGLSNRRELPKQLGEMLRGVPAGYQVALVMLDLDHFKTINDRFGHHVGDLVLQDFAQTLRLHARTSDLVARLGGEEFMWMTTAQEQQELIYRVERLRHAFSSSAGAREVTVSAGVAYWPDAQQVLPERLPELMQAADRALYRAKAEGRNRICLDHLASSGEGSARRWG